MDSIPVARKVASGWLWLEGQNSARASKEACSYSFHQLDPIPKWVKNMRTFESIQRRLAGVDLKSCTLCFDDEGVYIIHNEGRMGFVRRLKIRLNTKMKLSIL